MRIHAIKIKKYLVEIDRNSESTNTYIKKMETVLQRQNAVLALKKNYMLIDLCSR